MSGKTPSNPDEASTGSLILRQGVFVLLFLPALLFICTRLIDVQAQDARYLIDLSKTLPALPDDMPQAEQIREALANRAENEQPVNIFDDDLGAILSQVYGSSPYVRRVVSFERQFPSGLKIDLEFREPIAAVETHGRYPLVDQFGELLPLEVAKDRVVSPLITIHPGGDSTVDPGLVEEDWFLSAVKEGVRVLRDLEEFGDPEVFDDITIKAIDVSNFGLRRNKELAEITLVTDREWFDAEAQVYKKTLLYWGRSTKHALAQIELPVSAKMAHLRSVRRARPQGIRGLRSVELRFDALFYREK